MVVTFFGPGLKDSIGRTCRGREGKKGGRFRGGNIFLAQTGGATEKKTGNRRTGG